MLQMGKYSYFVSEEGTTMSEEEGTLDSVSAFLFATAANIFGWAGDPTEEEIVSATRALVAVEPAGLLLAWLETNISTETTFKHDHWKHIKKRKHLRSKFSYYDHTRVHFQLHRSTSSASRILTRKEPFLSSEITLAQNFDIVNAGRSPNAVGDHARTEQVDFKVDRTLPADSPPGDILITMVKEEVIVHKKVSKWKKVKLFRFSHWWEGEENAIESEIVFDCVKRENVVLYM